MSIKIVHLYYSILALYEECTIHVNCFVMDSKRVKTEFDELCTLSFTICARVINLIAPFEN